MAGGERTESQRVGGGFRQAVSLLRRNRDFRTLYLASLISLGGDWFLFVAAGLLVHDSTGSDLAVGFTLTAQELPYFLMSPFGGMLADRLDRRRLMVGCDLSRAVICACFMFLRAGTWWVAFPLLASLSTFSASFDPAAAAALPNLVDREDLGAANTLSGSTWGTMLAVGGALGGIVTAVFGRNTAFLIDGVSFVASAAMISTIRRRFSEERKDERLPGVLEATKQTVDYARKDHRVLALITVKGGFGIGAGVLVLLLIFSKRVFHAGAVGYGILLAARGLGALIGPFIGKWLAGPDDRRLFTVIGLSLAVFGTSYALFGVMPVIWLAAIAVGVAHLGGGAQWTLSSYGLQRIVPDHIRGRVFAFDGAMITITLAVSSPLTGFMAEHVGPRPTAVGLGVIALAWAATWTWLTTDVRRRGIYGGPGGREGGTPPA